MRLPGAVDARESLGLALRVEGIGVRGVGGLGGEYKAAVMLGWWRCGDFGMRDFRWRFIEFRFTASRSGGARLKRN